MKNELSDSSDSDDEKMALIGIQASRVKASSFDGRSDLDSWIHDCLEVTIKHRTLFLTSKHELFHGFVAFIVTEGPREVLPSNAAGEATLKQKATHLLYSRLARIYSQYAEHQQHPACEFDPRQAEIEVSVPEGQQ